MGLFDYLFDNEFSQRADINRAHERAETLENRLWKAHDRNKELSLQVQDLRRDLARTILLSEVLSQLVVEKGLCTREELLVHLDTADRADGVADGMRTPPGAPGAPEPRRCSFCWHEIGALAQKCIYCGMAVAEPTAAPSDEPPPDDSSPGA